MKKLEAEGILRPPDADEVGGLWLVNPVIPPMPPEDVPCIAPDADCTAANAFANWSALMVFP